MSETKRKLTISELYIGGERRLAFHRGVLAALTCVADFDQGTLYDEIVKSCGPKNLVAAAQGEEFDLEHLRKYGWVTQSGKLKRLR